MDEEFKYQRKFYEERLKFEHELINRRITWLLTSQTILLTGYSFGVKIDNNIVPVVGLFISLLILLGIATSARAKYILYMDHDKYVKAFKGQHPNENIKDAQWGVRTSITYPALITDFGFPIVFAVIWIILM